MKPIHLIRCSVGAISIFTMVACESHQSRGYRGSDRTSTDYSRNAEMNNRRDIRSSDNRPRSDANWNSNDSRGMTDSRGQSSTQPDYRGTLDRVDTSSPAWQGRTSNNSNAGTGYSSNQQPNQQSTASQPNRASSGQTVPSNSAAGTGYANAQQNGQSRGMQSAAEGSNQPTRQWSGSNQTNSNATGPSAGTPQPNTPNNASGQWNDNTQRNGEQGAGYSANQMNQQGQVNNRANASDALHVNDQVQRDTWNEPRDGRKDTNNEYGESRDRRDSYRDGSSRQRDTSRDVSSWYRYGPDNRHDGGGYSASMIYPERYRRSEPLSSRSMPRDSGAGTGYPMSWQQTTYRNRSEYSHAYESEHSRSERWDQQELNRRSGRDASSNDVRSQRWDRDDRRDSNDRRNELDR